MKVVLLAKTINESIKLYTHFNYTFNSSCILIRVTWDDEIARSNRVTPTKN